MKKTKNKKKKIKGRSSGSTEQIETNIGSKSEYGRNARRDRQFQIQHEDHVRIDVERQVQ